jgi:hypothetical protein
MLFESYERGPLQTPWSARTTLSFILTIVKNPFLISDWLGDFFHLNQADSVRFFFNIVKENIVLFTPTKSFLGFFFYMIRRISCFVLTIKLLASQISRKVFSTVVRAKHDSIWLICKGIPISPWSIQTTLCFFLTIVEKSLTGMWLVQTKKVLNQSDFSRVFVQYCLHETILLESIMQLEVLFDISRAIACFLLSKFRFDH